MARTGRPSRINEPYDTLPARGDQPARARTVADALVDYMRLGSYLETAAWVIGLSPSTVRLWLQQGEKALGRLEAGARRRDLSSNQRRYADFLVAVRAAMADSEHRDVSTLAALGRGGIPLTRTVEQWDMDDQGQPRLVGRTVTRTESLPDARVLMWRLERRNPERWGRRAETDPDEGGTPDEFSDDPLAEAQRALEDSARRQAAGLAALEAAGLGDIVDAEIVDETPPAEDT